MAVGDEAKVAIDSYVACARETTYGTYNSATTAVQVLSNSFKTSFNSLILDEIGVSRAPARRVQLGKVCEGAIEQYLHPQESVLMIANALGGSITSNSITGGATHSISTGNFNTAPTLGLSFNIRKGDTHVWRYLGGRCNSMKISAKVGEPIKASFDFIFLDSTQQSDNIAAILSVSTVNPFTFVNGVFRYNSSEANAATTTSEEKIQGFELTVNNNLVNDDSARALGSQLLSVLPATRQQIELTVTQRFDTTTTYQRMVQATQGAIELYFSGATFATDKFYAMTIRLPQVFNREGDPEITGSGDILSAEIPFDVVLSGTPQTTTSRAIGVTVTNNVASY